MDFSYLNSGISLSKFNFIVTETDIKTGRETLTTRFAPSARQDARYEMLRL